MFVVLFSCLTIFFWELESGNVVKVDGSSSTLGIWSLEVRNERECVSHPQVWVKFLLDHHDKTLSIWQQVLHFPRRWCWSSNWLKWNLIIYTTPSTDGRPSRTCTRKVSWVTLSTLLKTIGASSGLIGRGKRRCGERSCWNRSCGLISCWNRSCGLKGRGSGLRPCQQLWQQQHLSLRSLLRSLSFQRTHSFHCYAPKRLFQHLVLPSSTIAHNLSTHNFYSNNLSTHNFYSNNFSPHNISSHDLSAHNFSIHNLSTHNFYSNNFSPHNISSHDLSTHNFSIHNLSTHNFYSNNFSPHNVSSHDLSTHY